MNERKCMSCGENPAPRGTGRFPSAVIEINNPPEISVLRKVVIPVSMGTEEDVPPTIGKYFNVLLQYESNGHIYLYSSDGIPTAIEANIPQEVLDRIDQLEIDVDLLETGLANETTAREQADTTLQNNITAEATARANADTALNTAITSEVTARQEADTNLQNQITQEAQARAAADTAINGAITSEATARQTADAGLQSQIDAITASSDVKDIVGTKAELNNYDTSTLGNNDIIKVLQDESESNATTYYRWNATTQQFTLIGEEGPYYTKSQADTLLNAKQNTLTAGSNVQIVNDTISATDTTYTAGTGLALNGTQFSVDTTAIATQSDLTAGLATKQDTLTAGANVQINNNTISATDTTYTAGTGINISNGVISATSTGPNVVQTTGTSTTDVMSQKATTDMVFSAGYNPATKPNDSVRVQIGRATSNSNASIAIGAGSPSNLASAGISANGSVVIGSSASSSGYGGVAIGYGAKATQRGQFDISATTNNSSHVWGYNGSDYRLLTGLYDPQSAHDAATKGYVDTAVAGAGASAFTTNEWNALWA